MSSFSLKEKQRHILAMRGMTGPEMVEYLRSDLISDSVVWQSLALRVFELLGRLPEDLHCRMMLESDGCEARRIYVEGQK